ncbi:hypothetical protein [Mesorhizobium shangrilense]|uniref:Isochorismatase family protein n=1 Tax=Mesorhizobium shangrilense TaxID=460060 RepID=A0ABV2D725_9HYPH
MLNPRLSRTKTRKAPPLGVIVLDHDGTSFFQQGLTAGIATQGADTRFGSILTAVRDHGVVLAILPPWGHPFKLPGGKPVITFVEDLVSGTFGPGAFHRASLRRVLKMADNIVVNSCQGPELYLATAIAAGIAREHVFMVETRPEQESQWIETIKALAPGRKILLICEKPRGGVQ